MSIPLDKSEQTELPEAIKVDWNGRLRGRVAERQFDYVHNSGRDDDGDWIVDDDADPYSLSAWRTLKRLDTRIVIETAEEAYSIHGTLAHYTDPTAITWLNPMSAKSARRVRSEIREKLNALDGVEANRDGLTHVDIEVSDD